MDKFALMKVRYHVIFWVFILALLSIIFTPYYTSFSEAFYFVSMLFPVAVGTCYFFNFYLVPEFLLTRRYFKFTLYSLYMFIISLYLEMVVIMLSFIYLAKYSYGNMSPVSSDIFVLALTLYFIVLLFSFILLIQRTFSSEKKIGDLEDEKKKMKPGSFSVRSDRQMRTLTYEQVSWIESLGDYVKIHLVDGDEVSIKEKISKLETRLPDSFVRVHRSFIVNKYKVTSFSRESLTIDHRILPISRTYREQAGNRLS